MLVEDFEESLFVALAVGGLNVVVVVVVAALGALVGHLKLLWELRQQLLQYTHVCTYVSLAVCGSP